MDFSSQSLLRVLPPTKGRLPVQIPEDPALELDSTYFLERVAMCYSLNPTDTVHIWLRDENDSDMAIPRKFTAAQCVAHKYRLVTSIIRGEHQFCSWCIGLRNNNIKYHQLSKAQLKKASMEVQKQPKSVMETAQSQSSMSPVDSSELWKIYNCIYELKSMMGLFKEEVGELRKDITVLKNDRTNDIPKNEIKKEIDVLKKNEMKQETVDLKKEVQNIKESLQEVHLELSSHRELLVRRYFIESLQSTIGECRLVSICGKRKFPISGLSREACENAKMLLPKVSRSEYTNSDACLTTNSNYSEADLFVKFNSFTPFCSATGLQLFSSCQNTPATSLSEQVNYFGEVFQTSRFASNSSTGCAIAKVCHSKDILPVKFDMKDAGFSRVFFEMLQLESVLTACNNYYAGTSEIPAVQFAAFISPSVESMNGKTCREIIKAVIDLSPDAFPFLTILYNYNRIIFIAA